MDLRHLIGALLAIIVFNTPINAQQTFSLQQAIDYSIQNGLDIRSKQLDVTRAEREVKSYLATGLPQVNGALDYNYYAQIPVTLVPPFGPEQELIDVKDTDDEIRQVSAIVTGPDGNPVFGAPQEFQFGLRHNLTAGISARQLLFDGTFFTGLKAARVYKDLKARELVQTETDARLNVTKAYLTALITQRNIAILDSNISNLQTTFYETRAIYEAGFAEKLDVDRLRLSLQNLKTDSENLGRQWQMALNLLKFQMGYPIDEPIALSDDLDQLIAQQMQDDLLAQSQFDVSKRPEYQTLQVAEQLNELGIRRWQMGYVPSLYATAAHQRVLQADRLSDGQWFPTTVIGASLSVPIFDGFMKEANIQIAKIDLDKTLIQKQQFIRAANMEVANARIGYLNALERKRSQERSMELARDIYNTTQIKYKEGVGSSIELTQAESELYRTQGNYINALYDLLIAQTDFQKAMGEL